MKETDIKQQNFKAFPCIQIEITIHVE